jgi:purine-binding chemotaxis protein CheW
MSNQPAPALPAEHRLRVLRERAKALARPPAADADAGDSHEVLEFALASERYAIATRHVREVHALRQLTPLPGAPAFVRGIVNVRGRIVPVVDLKEFLGLPQSGITDLHRVILVGNDALEFGLVADMGLGVRRVPKAALLPPMSTLGGMGAEYVMGVTSEHLVMLDMDRILADPRILVDDSGGGGEAAA